MAEGVTREGLSSRKHPRKFLKIPAYSGFYARFTKIRRVMGDNSIRLYRNLPEHTIT